MENPNLFPAAMRAKRKCEDSDAVVELLNGVSLSHHSKKMRQELGSTSYLNTPIDAGYFDIECNNACTCSDIELVRELPNDLPSGPPEIELLEEPLPALPAPPVNDERAIVLYKPVNPPLFPGGPSAGSQLMVNAGILSSGILDSSNLLRGRNDAEWSWPKVSSSGVRITELTEEEAKQLETSHVRDLAVIPWVPNLSASAPFSQTLAQFAGQDVDHMPGEKPDVKPDVEAMDEDNELSMDFDNSQPSNSNASFFYEPWQQYGTQLNHGIAL